MSKPLKILTMISVLLGLCVSAQAQDACFKLPQDSTRSSTLLQDAAPMDSLQNADAVESAASDEQLEEFEQDIESVVFVPKGQWIAGCSVSWSSSDQSNYEFLVLEKITGDTYSFKVTPMFAYAFANDMAAGGKFGYSRSCTRLDNASVVLDSETDYSVDALYSISHNYYAMAIYRNYFSLGSSKRFGIFNEVQLEIGGGQSKMTKGRAMEMIGSYQRNFNLNVGLAPGMIVFLNNYSALEVNVGVLGFNYTSTKQTNQRIYVARSKTKLANFKINLFSISFGACFYL